jgi:hypothetical protein
LKWKLKVLFVVRSIFVEPNRAFLTGRLFEEFDRVF